MPSTYPTRRSNARSTCFSFCTRITNRIAAQTPLRAIGSSRVDPYSAMAGAAAALYGPLHGGANEEVLKMLSRIDNTRNIPEFIQRVKNGEGKLMGFGHR